MITAAVGDTAYTIPARIIGLTPIRPLHHPTPTPSTPPRPHRPEGGAYHPPPQLSAQTTASGQFLQGVV